MAASAHARCDRFKGTDPLIIGMSRRRLAEHLGHPDTTAGIPEARWMRAMAFERLVRSDEFVSPVLTTAVGKLGLARPMGVRRADCSGRVGATAEALAIAHDKALDGEATLLTSLGVPYLDLEDDPLATAVQPDFAIVAARADREDDPPSGSWLVMGDAKDYERVRSRIDDRRMLKGFLQVAMGAASARAWSALPDGMYVHRYGALAVPRNSFLQPTVEIEDLSDHCAEVRARAEERRQRFETIGPTPLDAVDVDEFVSHLVATFDHASCVTCALFTHCREELRTSDDPTAVLIETGVAAELLPAVVGVIDGVTPIGRAPARVVANVQATASGRARWTRARRVDPAGQPGAIDVVLAKADSAALGIHGVAVRRWDAAGEPTGWTNLVFDNPQSPHTRLAVMQLLGSAVATTLAERPDEPVHVVVPERVSADVLASIADSLAGVEIARLRWQHDLTQGRLPLTFDGEPATVPDPLSDEQRLALSFLLEEDRARAMALRTAVVDFRQVLSRHLIVGGPPRDAGRLDYLLAWAGAAAQVDHRVVSDRIAASPHAPGARLTNLQSDAIHASGRTGRDPDQRSPATYERLVTEELQYKQRVFGEALTLLADHVESSALWAVHHALEADAQAVWRRRLAFHASDLVRFGRTNEFWRDDNVNILEADENCRRALDIIGDPDTARESAMDAGVRDVAFADVIDLSPLTLRLRSRRIGAGSHVAAVVVGEEPIVEGGGDHKVLQGSFDFALPHGPLSPARAEGTVEWRPSLPMPVAVGDTVVVVDVELFFKGMVRGGRLKVSRPVRDTRNAPLKDCTPDSYEVDPQAHEWCCRPHEQAEAEIADWIAERRADGAMNPEAWPPVIDDDAFDIPARAPVETEVIKADTVPAELTMDDVE